MMIKKMAFYIDKLGFILTISILLQIISARDMLTQQQQLFQGANLSLNFKTINKRTYKILEQSERCSYANLTTCHSEQKFHEAYFENCFNDDCTIDNYYCLNNPYTSNTMHLCGIANPWNKRQRHIAVIASIGSTTASVHTIDCPLGFIHLNNANSFEPCTEDESIVIVKNSSDLVNVIARCNVEKNYCNKNGATTFKLKSKQDSCFDAKYDLNLQCNETEELMPDCNCTLKCKGGTKRVWLKGKYTCKNDRKSSSDVEAVPTGMDQQTEISRPAFTQETTILASENIRNAVKVDKGDDINGATQIDADTKDKARLLKGLDAKEDLGEEILIGKLHAKFLKVEKHESNTNIWNVMVVIILIVAAIGIARHILVNKLKIKIGRLLLKGCDNDVAISKTKQVKEVNKIATTTVHKTSYNFYADSAHVNINEDHRSEIQDKLFTVTDCKAIKEEEDTLHEVEVHESNDSTISPAKAIIY